MATLAPRQLFEHPQTGTCFFWLQWRMRSTRRSTTNSISTSLATSRLLLVLAQIPQPYRGSSIGTDQVRPRVDRVCAVNPGKLNTASGGIGTPQHVAGELFKMMTGTNIIHVPYRGAAPALTDLLGGQVQMMFATMPSCIEYVRAGRLRPLAVTGGALFRDVEGRSNGERD